MAIHGKKKHHSHPDHNLQLEYVKEAYDCNYCMEVGFGKRYSCPEKECDFHMHDACVDLPFGLISHHLVENRDFFLLVGGGKSDCCCTACARDTRGSFYISVKLSSCSKAEAYLHPCCAMNLENQITGDDGVKLLLRGNLSSNCHFCGLQELSNGRKSWGYVSQDDKESHQFHLFCVKKKLIENWENIMLGVDRNGDPIGEGDGNDCHHELTALLLSNINIPPEQSHPKVDLPDLSHLLSDQKANIPRIRRPILE